LFLQAEAPAKKEKAVEEVTTLKNKVADGDEYFAVAHIFASFNDTFVVSIAIMDFKVFWRQQLHCLLLRNETEF